MNNVCISGRLTRDPEVRYTTGEEPMAVCKFSVAVDRQGKNKGTDFPSVVVFGKQSEACEKYLSKGKMVLIQGRIQTGSYKDKEGRTVYTTDIVAERVEFGTSDKPKEEKPVDNVQQEFAMLDENVPF